MIPSILDRFNVQGPNGNHACLVTSPARMSLIEAKSESWIGLFQIDVARALAAQLATVIRYMHSEGFVHGDLHRGNILLQTQSNFDKLPTKELYDLYGEPGSQCFGGGRDFRGFVRMGYVPEYQVVVDGLQALRKFMRDDYERLEG